MTERRERILTVEFLADDDITDWVFDQIAAFIHNEDGVIDPTVAVRCAHQEDLQ